MAHFLNFKKFIKDHSWSNCSATHLAKMCRCTVNHTRRHKIKITHQTEVTVLNYLYMYIYIYIYSDGANAFQSPHVAGAVTVEHTLCSHTQTHSYGRWNYHPRAGLHHHQGQCCHHPMYQAFQMLPGSLWPEPRSRAFGLINLNRITLKSRVELIRDLYLCTGCAWCALSKGSMLGQSFRTSKGIYHLWHGKS